LDGVAGYVFLDGSTPLHILRETRTGSWRDINTGGPTTPITRRYLTMWLDHGTNPVNATYSYLVAPGATVAQTEQLARRSPLLVLRNTVDAQAILSGQLLLANFWTPGRVAEVIANTPCSVVRRARGRHLDLALSDPTQLAGAVQLRLLLPGATIVQADEGVRVRRTLLGLEITADVSNAAGATRNLTIRR
jgi:hyaluronate lyase